MQILSGLILLAVLIVFHELGHFLFAKMLGVKVLVFSLGFGPKIFSFKHGDTEYRLSAIPLGGYVRMFGESLEEKLSPEEKSMSFIHQAIWRKSLIAFAGPLFNFILPIILFFALLVGTEQVYAPIVGTVLKDSVAEKSGLLPEDRIEAVNNQPIETFGDLAHLIAENPEHNLRFKISRPQFHNTRESFELDIKPEAKSAANPLDKNKLVGRIGIMPAIEQAVVIINPDSALYKSGVRNFDTISALNNLTITSMSVLEKALLNIREGDTITIKRPEPVTITVPANNLGAPKNSVHIINKLPTKIELSEQQQKILKLSEKILDDEQKTQIKHWGLAPALGVITKVEPSSLASSLDLAPGDRLVAINGEKISSSYHLQQNLIPDSEPIKIVALVKNNYQPLILIFDAAPKQEQKLKLDTDLAGTFGVTLAEVFSPGDAFTRQVGVLEALKRAVSQTYAIAAMTLKSLWMLISGAVPASQVGGPIMIFDMAQQAAHKGLSYYIFIMCLMSVNLGLLNLLPIPALDGGHLLLFGIEAVQRKPLTPKTRAIATQIGFAILLALMGLAIFNDLYRLFK
jgi:regulator of sigma E protease